MLPKAIWEGTFRIFGVELQCAVLDNGARIIEANSLKELFCKMGKSTMTDIDNSEIEHFTKWQRGESDE